MVVLSILGNKYGHRLLFMAIAVNTTLSADNLGYERGLPIYNQWEDFVQSQVHIMLFFYAGRQPASVNVYLLEL